MKRCRDCKQFKPLEDFPVAIAATGIRRTRCFLCYRTYLRGISRADYQRHKQRRLTAAETYRHQHAESVKEHNRTNAKARNQDPEWRQHMYPSRYARSVVQRALKNGRLVRPQYCQQCLKMCKPDAAHSDYSQPLLVRWLCRSCHVQWDKSQPKLPAAHLLIFRDEPIRLARLSINQTQ